MREAFTKFFDLLEVVIRDKKILPRNITNIDEHGLQEGESRAGIVLGTSLTRRAYVTASDSTNWVSILECGTATGKRLTPCVVFQGQHLQGQWYSPDFELEKELLC